MKNWYRGFELLSETRICYWTEDMECDPFDPFPCCWMLVCTDSLKVGPVAFKDVGHNREVILASLRDDIDRLLDDPQPNC